MQHRVVGSHRVLGAYLLAVLVGCGSDGDSPRDLPPPGGEAVSLEDATATTAEDTAVRGRIAVTGAHASAAMLHVLNGPHNGELVLDGAAWTYTPARDFTGTDDVEVVAELSSPPFGLATATLRFTVTPVADPPAAGSDSHLEVQANKALTIPNSQLLNNDYDPDGDRLTIVSVAAVSGGAPVMRGDDVVFTPVTDFQGTAEFTYTISDGAMTSTATVSLEVRHLPVTAKDDAVTMDEGGELVVDDAVLLANDRDPEGRPLAISEVQTAVFVSGTLVATVSHKDGRVTIKPSSGFYGEATFSYVVSNGFRSTRGFVKLTVAPRPLTTDLAIDVIDQNTTVRPGATVDFIIDVWNDTSHPVDVEVAAAFPAGMACAWRCQPDLPRIDRCAATGSGDIRDRPHFSAGVTYHVTCQVSSTTTADALTTTATVTPASWITDRDAGNNTSTDTNTVVR